VALLVHEADAVELDRRAKARGKRDFATIILSQLLSISGDDFRLVVIARKESVALWKKLWVFDVFLEEVIFHSFWFLRHGT
jgi:hypothetical protein